MKLQLTALLVLLTFALTAQNKHIGVGAKPEKGAKVYFDGSKKSLIQNWKYWEGPRFKAAMPIKWEIQKSPNGKGTVLNTNDPAAANGLYGAADIVTKDEFKDFRAHVEFLCPPLGNSGVYLQNRFEIQVLDGDSTSHGMAAIINEKPAPYKNYAGTGNWNAYDIVFRAARFTNGKLTENPRVTVYWNGTLVHKHEQIYKVWGGPPSGIDGGNNDGLGISDTPGGLKLQAEGHNVVYRNIWIKPLNLDAKTTEF
jgi:hypothetical protein